MSSFQHIAIVSAPGSLFPIGCSLNADVNIVFAGEMGRLVVADVAERNFKMIPGSCS